MSPKAEISVAVVAGGAGVLGDRVANRLRRAGHTTVVLDRRKPRLTSGVAYSVELSDERAVGEAVERVEGIGPINVLVNAQGYSPKGPDGLAPAIDKTSAGDFMSVVEMNLLTCFLTMQEIAPRMAARGTGRVVNVGSTAGRCARTTAGVAYSAAKAGLEAMTKVFARRYSPEGVLISCVAPGKLDNPGLADNQQARAAYVADIPLGRIARPEEPAELIAFLCSDANTYLTGSTVVFDGGRLA